MSSKCKSSAIYHGSAALQHAWSGELVLSSIQKHSAFVVQWYGISCDISTGSLNLNGAKLAPLTGESLFESASRAPVQRRMLISDDSCLVFKTAQDMSKLSFLNIFNGGALAVHAELEAFRHRSLSDQHPWSTWVWWSQEGHRTGNSTESELPSGCWRARNALIRLKKVLRSGNFP